MKYFKSKYKGGSVRLLNKILTNPYKEGKNEKSTHRSGASFLFGFSSQ